MSGRRAIGRHDDVFIDMYFMYACFYIHTYEDARYVYRHTNDHRMINTCYVYVGRKVCCHCVVCAHGMIEHTHIHKTRYTHTYTQKDKM